MRFVLIGLALVLAGCAEPPAPRAETGFSRVAFLQEAHPLAGVIWDVAAGREIDAETLADRLRAADVAILGEIHDNPRHHVRQAQMVSEIAPAGVAFEMVPEASEEGISVYLEQGGRVGEIGPAIGWNRLGWPDWSYYRPIFEAAPGAQFTGGAVPSTELSTAIRQGAATAFGAGADRYGLSSAPDAATQEALEDEMIASHCNKLPRQAAGGMVEAQRLRDARFASAVERAHLAGGPTVLITGNGHARADRGVPAYLALSQPDLSVAALGQVEVVEGLDTPERYGAAEALPYDYVWFSARVDRPDPCASFN
ncbi:MAG: ChaN family lipoprotein [Pseudomonadota bacterium]